MADFILVILLLLVIGTAVGYMIKSRKNGVKCIGCPSGCSCSHEDTGHCGKDCDCHTNT